MTKIDTIQSNSSLYASSKGEKEKEAAVVPTYSYQIPYHIITKEYNTKTTMIRKKWCAGIIGIWWW